MELPFDTLINFHTAYVLSVTLICLVLSFVLNIRIDRIRAKRIIGLKRKHLETVVDTETPVDNPEKLQRKIGQESIETRFNFIKRFLPIFIGVIWVSMVILPYLTRVPAIHVSLVIGSISVLIGIAARPFIENIISGLVISFAQPVRIGDTVLINEHYGIIEDIKLTHSIVNIWDWRRLVIPNSQMLTKEIINYSLNDLHIWAWVEFYVSSEADLDEVEKIAKEVATSSEHFIGIEEPAFWVMGMEKDSIRCWVASWADSPNSAWAAKHHIRTGLAKYFRQKHIPFNLYNIHQASPVAPGEMFAKKENGPF